VNFNNTWIDFECPACNYQDQLQLVDIKTERTIFCNNCKISIRLVDENASTHIGIESINKTFKDFEDLLKKF
jgi:transcription elongation factor Elf1